MESIYIQVKKDLLKKIETHLYKSGDRLPSERDLSEIYGVSRMTARQALKELEEDGYVYRETGRGTFVSSPQFLQKNVKSFTETVTEQGFIPSTKVLESAIVYDLKSISQKMGLEAKTRYYKVKRLRLGNETPIALETLYIPENYCPDLRKHDLSQSLYHILEEEYGYVITTISCQMDACIPTRVLAEVMGLHKQIALLKVNGITYAQGNKKLFYEESFYRPDLYKYEVDIHKRK